jgi:hypothetical protein
MCDQEVFMWTFRHWDRPGVRRGDHGRAFPMCIAHAKLQKVPDGKELAQGNRTNLHSCEYVNKEPK